MVVHRQPGQGCRRAGRAGDEPGARDRGDARAGRWRDLSMLTESQASALLPVYAQFPVRPARGEGSWIIDVRRPSLARRVWRSRRGEHGALHPHVVRAIAEQASQLIFYSTVLPHPNREQLAARIAALMPEGLDRSFFCNSGAEANENALGLARKRTGRELVVSVTGGWHGRTVATLAVTDGAKYEAGARRAGMPLSPEGPVRRRRCAGARDRRVGRGADRGAGAGHVRCARLLARRSSGPRALPAPGTAWRSSSTRSSAALAARRVHGRRVLRGDARRDHARQGARVRISHRRP